MAKDDKPRTRRAKKVLKREGLNWKTASSAAINAAYERDMRRRDAQPKKKRD